MTEKFPSTGIGNVNSSLFSHGQLRQILSAYAEGVLQKGWRDYSLNCEKHQTLFGVVERGEGAPTAVIYSFSASRIKNKTIYTVMDGQKPIAKSEKFLEILNIFREIGKPGQKKTAKFKIIK